MSFSESEQALNAALGEQKKAARGLLTNILDLASTEAAVLIPAVLADIAKLAREHIPATETSALTIFDQIVAGGSVPVANYLTKEVQSVLGLAVSKIDVALGNPVTATASASLEAAAITTEVLEGGNPPSAEVQS